MASADLTVLQYIAEVTPGVTPDNGVKASVLLTGTAQPANADTITVAGLTYTFQTTLTNVARNVLIGATLAITLANLQAAANKLPGAGTKYAALTTKNPSLSITSVTATTALFTLLNGGTAGNALGSTKTGTSLTFGTPTFTGGTNSTTTLWRPTRYTGESLKFAIQNVQSAEIRPDRTESELVQTSGSAAGDINIELSYGSFDDLVEAVMCGTWTANVLQNGTNIRFFTFRKTFPDITPAQYHYFTGTAVESLKLDIQLGKIVSGSFGLMSFGIDPIIGVRTAAIGGESTGSALSTDPLNGVTNFQDFMIDGIPYSGCISSMKLDIKNSIRANQCLGSLIARDMKLGTLMVTGTMDLYFNEGSNFERFIKGTEFPLTFALQDPDGNRVVVDLPRCKYESGDVVAGSRNSDVMMAGAFRALFSDTAGYVMRLTRTPV